jgi:hypothetical protein
MEKLFRLRRVGIAVAGATLILAGAAGASAARGPQPGTGQPQAHRAALAAANPVMTAGSELRFVAVAPCRILNTRVAGGVLNRSSRSFRAIAPYSAQGGAAGGCGIPAAAVAIQVNIIAVSQARTTGLVKGWATGAAEPNALLLQYDPSGPVANMVTVPLGPTGRFTLKSSAKAHLLADIAGYYVRPLYATIDATGGTIAVFSGIQSGLVSTARSAVGEYTLTFNRNVTNCVPAATDYLFTEVHEISVDSNFSNDSTVYVSVKNSTTGASEDTVFHISLTC